MFKSNFKELSESKRILLLQGPIGYFFYDLSLWLTNMGCTVFKINFNGGDEYFYPIEVKNTYKYTNKPDKFSEFLESFIEKNKIYSIVCFGDTRFYHRIAHNYCQTNSNIQFWAFEEGYFRPDYITLEKNGVNAFSKIPRNANFFLSESQCLPDPIEPKKLASGFFKMAKLAIKYYLYANLKKWSYPNYQHHRSLNILYYIKVWTKSGFKRLFNYSRDSNYSRIIEKGILVPFYLVPLQVHNDSQVKYHCDFGNIESFLIYVLDSFREFAPSDSTLVIKHHPMDIGIIDYGYLLKSYKNKYPSISNRVHYVYDIPMPILLRKTKGVVTLNSTSGLSALLHQVPVITLGRANYDFEKMTFQGKLHSFWNAPTLPDRTVFEAYRKYHLNKTHINGSYYNKIIFK